MTLWFWSVDRKRCYFHFMDSFWLFEFRFRSCCWWYEVVSRCVNVASAEKCMGYCGFNMSVYGWQLVSVAFVLWSLLVLLKTLSVIFKPFHLQLTEYLHEFVFYSVCVCVSRSLFYVAAAPQSRQHQRKDFTFSYLLQSDLLYSWKNPFISLLNHLPWFVFAQLNSDLGLPFLSLFVCLTWNSLAARTVVVHNGHFFVLDYSSLATGCSFLCPCSAHLQYKTASC